MSIDEQLAALLGAIVYVSPGVAPDKRPLPYCIYARAGTLPDNTLDGAPVSEHVRFEIDVHALTYGAAHALATSIKAALQAAAFGGFVTDDRYIYEDVVKAHRRVIDFAIPGVAT